MSTATELLSTANHNLHNKYIAYAPVTLSFDGRPKLHVMSLNPLMYEQYGLFVNRGPQLCGQFALRAFIWRQQEEAIFPFAIFEVDHRAMYGHQINELPVLNTLVSCALGREVSFTQT